VQTPDESFVLNHWLLQSEWMLARQKYIKSYFLDAPNPSLFCPEAWILLQLGPYSTDFENSCEAECPAFSEYGIDHRKTAQIIKLHESTT
jgi:hypothetical protein